MVEANSQAIELNRILEKTSIYNMLSGRGKAIFFPKKGILAQTSEAKGKNINATIGIALEDDLTPMRFKSIQKLIKDIEPEDAFTYASSFGKQQLRESWLDQIKKKNPSLKSDISMPVITNAVTHALSIAGFLFINPGDKIITPDLYWENYNLIFSNTYGGVLDTFNTFKDKKFDIESLKDKLNHDYKLYANKEENEKKTILLLNFPNNPTGYTPTDYEAEDIIEIIRLSAEQGNRIIVIIDDAYFGLVYKYGILKESLFARLSNIHENVLAVKVDGSTKEDYVWGFRVGFITFGIKSGNSLIYSALENKAAGAVRATISNASNLSQSLVLKAYESSSYQNEKEDKYLTLKQRYDEVKRVLKDEKFLRYFEALPFNSGYFMCIKLKNIDAEGIRQILLEKYSTGVIAINNNTLRIAYSSLNINQIEKLFNNIYEACSEIKKYKLNLDEAIISRENRLKIEALRNPKVIQIIEDYTKLCTPSRIIAITDDQKEIESIKNAAVELKEEKKLAMMNHTIHFDGYNDQGRDKDNTKVLVPREKKLSKYINQKERDEGIAEVHELLKGIMKGKNMFVRFFCLGPLDSTFSIPAMQITDSAYVAHSEDLLYRKGYEQFKKLTSQEDFFYFIHSAGELDENGNSINTNKRKIYMDIEGNRVFTINNQYAGNSIGLKKLALRLGINKADKEDWLCEHMFIMGIRPEDKNRTTYFTGAFPSACGKTSTAMAPGQTIIGDDIAYIKIKDGIPRAANVEQGIFGIIMDVNPKDDPLIYKALTSPREVIFSNILVKENIPFWTGMGREAPMTGWNHSGIWRRGKKDENGKEIPVSHKNARYTIRLDELDNADEKADDPEGVEIKGIIYGSRDSDTSVPVAQSFDWYHGVFIGASLESEMGFASSSKEGELTHDPMANRDFLVIPVGKYIDNHFKFGEKLSKKPLVFAVNYFLKKEGKFLNEKTDKKIWLLWMEARVHGEYPAIETPIGFIPRYEDLKDLFMKVFKKNYTEQDYISQFSIKVNNYIARLDRIEQAYRQEEAVPEELLFQISEQRKRLIEAREHYRKTEISPFDFEKEVLKAPEPKRAEKKRKGFFSFEND